MNPIIQTYVMKATPAQVFEALTTPAIIQKWSGAPATMDGKAGTKFSLFGGAIHGANLIVVPNQKLVQEWYAGNWEMPTIAVFTLTSTDQGTTVELLHEGVPEAAHAEISAGWGGNYLGSMQKMFAV